jgi:hypothetical protein
MLILSRRQGVQLLLLAVSVSVARLDTLSCALRGLVAVVSGRYDVTLLYIFTMLQNVFTCMRITHLVAQSFRWISKSSSICARACNLGLTHM